MAALFLNYKQENEMQLSDCMRLKTTHFLPLDYFRFQAICSQSVDNSL